jgi:hypothetical protein
MAAPDDAKRDLIARLPQLPMRHRWLRSVVLAASLVSDPLRRPAMEGQCEAFGARSRGR